MSPADREALKARFRNALRGPDGAPRFAPSHPELMYEILVGEVAVWDVSRPLVAAALDIATRAEDEARTTGDDDEQD